MSTDSSRTEHVAGYCALCVSRCGTIATVFDGRFVAFEPDPLHPTGQAICAKGRAAPELVYHGERLTHPLRRTRPKGDPDPGWERISWDEALDETAAQLRRLARDHGPESVAFAVASPSTSALSDALGWVERLKNAFGSRNFIGAFELCGWGRYGATLSTFGESVPGVYMPDLEHAGCILYWGYNPNLARLTHAVATTDALKRGARLIVVDPRRTGPASKADVWLRVRPGTDGALALGIAGVMIERGWFDADFLRDWTNAPMLVRSDTGRLLRAGDLEGAIAGTDDAAAFVAWSEQDEALVTCGRPAGDGARAHLALERKLTIETGSGPVDCTTVFSLVAEMCRRHTPDLIEEICGVDRAHLVEAARLLWHERPVAYYAWSGVEMQSSATQIARAIAQLYALTGSFDRQGGNVRYASAAANPIEGHDLISRADGRHALGFDERPLGPARFGFTTTEELYRGILEGQPYAIRGLVGFGTNLLLSHADGLRGREALSALEFTVYADLFMSPTAELADIVLPVASAFETETLRFGFEVSPEAQSHVQLRRRVVDPIGESRSDTDIVFDLACRLGLGEVFWDGSVEAAYRHHLAPSGITLEELRAHPRGVDAKVRTTYRKFSETVDGAPRGFATPSGMIELYSETLLAHGYAPLPEYEPPLVGPATRGDLRERFPLILTCAKHLLFCESQNRQLPSLRRRALEPEVELHPETAEVRGIAGGDWVRLETERGSVRARARMNPSLEPGVVCGQHGWWQACEAIGAPGYDPFGRDGANFNLLIGCDAIDPVSGSVPHRAYLCEVRRVSSSE